MEAGFVALLVSVIIAALVGIVIGVSIEKRKSQKVETQGDIYVYYSESGEGPSLLLDYSVPINDIASRKRVLFDVVVIK